MSWCMRIMACIAWFRSSQEMLCPKSSMPPRVRFTLYDLCSVDRLWFEIAYQILAEAGWKKDKLHGYDLIAGPWVLVGSSDPVHLNR